MAMLCIGVGERYTIDMRLFGKRSNSQPEMTDVPPELRPYYREQAVAAHARRTALRLMLVFMVVVLVGAAGLWGWLHVVKPKHNSPSSNTSNSQIAQNPSNATGQSTPNAVPSPTNTDTTPPSSSPSQQAPSPSPSPTTTPSSSPQAVDTATPNSRSIPNTGPGEAIIVMALVAGIAAMIGYHFRQRRLAR